MIKIDKETLEPISNIVIEAMNKLEKATGWIMLPRGKRKDREEAIAAYIKSIDEDTNLAPLMKAALKTEARNTLKRYCNLNDIANIAIQQMEADAKPENVDEDWMNNFKQCAENVSREDAKVLWGKILASECNRPGYIPKLLMHILTVMSKEDATKFETLCGFIVKYIISDKDEKVESLLLIASIKSSKLLEENGLNFLELKNLEALGLISVSSFDLCLQFGEEGEKIVGFIYGQSLIDVRFKGNKLPIGYVTLTEVGEILSGLIQKKELNGFLEYIVDYYQSNEREVRLLPNTFKV